MRRFAFGPDQYNRFINNGGGQRTAHYKIQKHKCLAPNANKCERRVCSVESKLKLYKIIRVQTHRVSSIGDDGGELVK